MDGLHFSKGTNIHILGTNVILELQINWLGTVQHKLKLYKRPPMGFYMITYPSNSLLTDNQMYVRIICVRRWGSVSKDKDYWENKIHEKNSFLEDLRFSDCRSRSHITLNYVSLDFLPIFDQKKTNETIGEQ